MPDPSRNLIYFRGRLSGYYPNGYSMPMQFCGFYGTTNGAYGSGWGLYFGTHDDGFFGKQFTVGPGNPFQFELSSYNDDVCKSYVPEPVDPFVDPPKGRRDIKPFVGTFCRPVWKDYRQSSYRLMMRVFNQNPADGPMAWTDLADIYKAWARRQEWAQIDRYERDRKDIGFGFYGDVGLASGFLTAEMTLAAPDGKPENSYFRYIHNILKLPDEKNSFAKTLFGIAWDWHWPFGDRHDGGDQFGNNQKFWTAHYGLATQSPPYRLNFDQIKGISAISSCRIFSATA
ncbi:MAG: hypothetical protein M5R36_28635 [Deltaproteobacteria bacterium]|nr:hypothetical protein [Deltaproteobacteria bacterium]